MSKNLVIFFVIMIFLISLSVGIGILISLAPLEAAIPLWVALGSGWLVLTFRVYAKDHKGEKY